MWLTVQRGDEKIRGALLSGKKVLTEGGTGGFFQVLNQKNKNKKKTAKADLVCSC